jgi:LysR family glycine cleavage system transcriptional activator
LNITPSAISHQVAKLERLLDVRLFERSSRGFVLTPAGTEYLRRVSIALDGISTATDNVRKRVSNSLFVHSAPSFAALWLMPRLADFARSHSGIALSLSASVVHSDFASSHVDIDIRYGNPNYPNLATELIFEERILPLASPRFLKQHRVRTVKDLMRVPLIQSMVNVVQWRDWFRSRQVDYSPGAFAYRFDRTSMALDAAIQGLGVALDSSSIAAQHLHERRLQRVFSPTWCVHAQAHHLVCPQRHLERDAVAKFVDWIRRHARNPEAVVRSGVKAKTAT